ncbi:MAG TPA: tetratricopeptide repeat protein [Pirellulales bacterium]|nr:tetratricopeptide repeat protein [Pirellulales bacterium]
MAMALDIGGPSVARGDLVPPHFAWFEVDGRLLLVQQADERVQVFDAATAEPIGLPINTQRLVHSPMMKALPTFGPRGESLISTARDRLRIWSLAADPTSVDDLVTWSRLVDGHRIDEVGGYTPSETVTQAKSWSEAVAPDRLQSRRSALDVVNAWHANQAWFNETQALFPPYGTKAEMARFWFAAKFHLDHLMLAGTFDRALWMRRGRAEVELGDWDGAANDFTKAVELGLDRDPQVWVGRARARFALGLNDAAHNDMAHAFELGANEFSFELADWQKRAAIDGLGPLIDREPNNHEIVERRAQLCRQVGEWQLALDDFTRLIDRNELGQWRQYYYGCRGDAYTGLGRWAEAIDDYTAAMGTKENDPSLRQSRAGAFALSGDCDHASADLVKARPLLANTIENLYLEALVFLLAGDVAGYRRACAEVLEQVMPPAGSADWLRNLSGDDATRIAWTCVLAPGGVDDLPLIGTLAEKGAATKPHDFESLRTLGAVLVRRGEEAKAVGILTAAAKLNDEGITAWLLLALAHHGLGEADEARTWFVRAERAIQERPVRLPWDETAKLTVLKREVERY